MLTHIWVLQGDTDLNNAGGIGLYVTGGFELQGAAPDPGGDSSVVVWL